jgi:hypothetical protein
MKEGEKHGGVEPDGKPPIVMSVRFVGLTKPEDKTIATPASALCVG